MEIYKISGFSNYGITKEGAVYKFTGSAMTEVFINNRGTLKLKKLNKICYKNINYLLKGLNHTSANKYKIPEIILKRQIEDREDDFAW